MEQVDGGDAGQETDNPGKRYEPQVMFGRKAIENPEHIFLTPTIVRKRVAKIRHSPVKAGRAALIVVKKSLSTLRHF
jgi:hypothetical protein